MASPMKTETTPNEEKLKSVLRRVLEMAEADEGQSWHFEFSISEPVYDQWKELCDE